MRDTLARCPSRPALILLLVSAACQKLGGLDDVEFGLAHGGQGGSTPTGGQGGVGATAGQSGQGGSGNSDSGGSGGRVTGLEGQSCIGGLDCGGISCCQNILVQAGTFPMGRCGDRYDPAYCRDGYAGASDDETPEHDATVADFYLDTFEVTVGRFRRFVEAYDGVPAPASNAGAHPLIAGSGWQDAWDSLLPASHTAVINALKCSGSYQTWTDSVANDRNPINCVDWYLAFAFCIWDGGRLPTEAEWEAAAAGGDANRLYPWGADSPGSNPSLADCETAEDSPFVAVGSHTLGAARWGHQDLCGSVWEWVLDWYEHEWYRGGGALCNNCANLTSFTYRALRGGGWHNGAFELRAAYRSRKEPLDASQYYGFRCARN
jgi:formylglycine-generating enzyme